MITCVRCAATERRVFTGNTDEHSAKFCSQPVFFMICALERVALLSLAYVGSVRNKLKLIVIYSQRGKDI
ncbi:hypothetical protein T12_9167 [Trichinella patagoniensis]|uniref:Uncharacterized protein n=1 Tax=Trichinella patagoniensis TaxID=990121 RepID=A0A0V0ZD37_9BILA|nr:hypothetical protein T12_9167 [Trichinella patagoniensis]